MRTQPAAPPLLDLLTASSYSRANTPSLRSIRTWLDAFFISPLEDDGTISADHYRMSNEFDIGVRFAASLFVSHMLTRLTPQRNTLSLLFTILELQYGLIRATTPFYSTYTIKPLENNPSTFPNVLNDQSPEARALQRHWKQGRIWHTIDVVGTAEAEGIERSKLVRQISRWEMCVVSRALRVSSVVDRAGLQERLVRGQGRWRQDAVQDREAASRARRRHRGTRQRHLQAAS